jgi:4-hydroxybenzoate polyprenyltransferase
MTPLQLVRHWGEMIRFSHSIFALPFAVVGMMLAARSFPGGLPMPGQVGLILVCMVTARSFAMTFNRLADALHDARNPRTAGRHLPAGVIRRGQAWAFLAACGVLFVAGCAGFLAYGNVWPIALAVPVLAVLAGYSYTKRFTSLSHFILGACIALSPVAAWLAINPATLGWPAVLLMAATACWIAGFDIIYACQDIEVDRREGLFSLPARLGPGGALWVSRLAHGVTVICLAWLGWLLGLGPLYWAGVAIVAALLAIEQSLVRPTDFSRVNLAFFTVNGVVSIVFAATTIADLFVGRA